MIGTLLTFFAVGLITLVVAGVVLSVVGAVFSLGLALAAGLVLVGPMSASADCPFPEITDCFHHPLDLSAGGAPHGPGIDDQGDFVVEPPRVIDPPVIPEGAVVWPPLDKSVWEQYKDSYKVEECD